MRKINIFLALGEKDVKDDKNEISSYINHLNDKYEDKDIYIRLITDDDIDKKLKDITEEDINKSEMFFIIFGNDIKDEALKEFNLAYDKFKKDSNPKIVTFSKKIDKRKESVTNFLEKLGNKLGHYYNEYEHIDSIKLELVEQLESLGLKEFNLTTKDGLVYLNDEVVVNLDNIPMFFNNEHLTKLKEEYKELEDKYWSLKRQLKKEPSDELEKELQEVSEKYVNTKKDIDYLENKIFSLSQTFVNISGKGILTGKYIYARECLENGDLEETEKVLDLKEISEDINNNHNLIEDVKTKIKGHIQELILRANTYKVDIKNPNRNEEIIKSYEMAIQAEKENGLPRDTLKIYAEYCEEQENYEKAAELIDLYINYLKSEQISVDPDLYLELENNYTMCNKFDDALKQYNIINEILSKNFDDLLYVKSQLQYGDTLARRIQKNQFEFKDIFECPNTYSNLVKHFYKNSLYNKNDAFSYLFIKSNYRTGKYLKDITNKFSKSFHIYMDRAVEWIEEKKFKDRSQFKDLDELTMMIFKNYAEYQEDHNEYADALKYYEKAFNTLEKIFTDKPEVYSDLLSEILDKLNPLYDKYNLYDRKVECNERYANIIENHVTVYYNTDEQKNSFNFSLLAATINRYIALIIREKNNCSIESVEKAIDYREEFIKELKKSNIELAKNELEFQLNKLKDDKKLLDVIRNYEKKGIKEVQNRISEGNNYNKEEKYQETISSNSSFINNYLNYKDSIKTWSNFRTVSMFNNLFIQITYACMMLGDDEQSIKYHEQQIKFLDDVENNGNHEKVKTWIENLKILPEKELASIYFNRKEYKKALRVYDNLESIQDTFKKIRYDGYKEGDLEETRQNKILTLVALKKYKEAEELKGNTLYDLDHLINIYNDGKGANYKYRKIKLDILKNTKELHNKKSQYNEIGEIDVNVRDENGKNMKNASVLITGDNYSYEANLNGNGITFINIKPGKYTAKLTKLPFGYMAKEKEYSVNVEVGEVPEITFNLEKIVGKLFVKFLNDNGEPLADCKLEIYDEEEYYLTEIITDENGYGEVTLDAGKYYALQTDGPVGYIIDVTIYEFTISEEHLEEKITLVNERYKGKVQFEVKDIKGNPIKDLKINIYDYQKKLILNITTNKDGFAGVKFVPFGTYYYKLEGKKKYVEFQIKEKDEIVKFNIVGEKNE